MPRRRKLRPATDIDGLIREDGSDAFFSRVRPEEGVAEPDELLSLLRGAIESAIEDKSAVAVGYSGGVDSSVVARLASENHKVRAYCCATEGSFDGRNVTQCADGEHLLLKLIIMSPADLRRYVRKVSSALGTSEPIPIAYTMPLVRVIDECVERVVIVGGGADELFGGYSKYGTAKDPQGAMTKDLAKMRLEIGKLETYASSVGKALAAPFIVDPVVEFANRLPLSKKLSPAGRKLVLRECATLLGLPSCSRPKKAAQYSSGILKEMERQAKADRLDLRAWTESASEK